MAFLSLGLRVLGQKLFGLLHTHLAGSSLNLEDKVKVNPAAMIED
jgi:hypothetical protein